MNKIKRELLRIGVQAAVNYPSIFPDSFAKKIKMAWNINQRENAIEDMKKHQLRISRSDLPKDVQILDLSCISGFGESVHPDVLFIPEGFGAERRKYLMTLTPLPRGMEYFENPEFLVSDDGISWHIPHGGRSPLVDPPTDWVGYNSDPTLFYDEGTLYMIYRRTEYVRGGAVVKLLIIDTQDGIGWSAPRIIAEKFYDRKNLAVLMSPSVVKTGGEYVMWYVNGEGGVFSVMRSVSKGLYHWQRFSSAALHRMPEGTEPWHLDVIAKDNGDLLMTLCFQQAGNYLSDRGILFASSTDAGITWNVFGDVLETGECSFCANSLYKGSALLKEEGGIRLYYSGQDKETHWLTAVRDMKLYP